MNVLADREGFFRGGEVRVKICGVTNAADAALAAAAGADAIGVNFFAGSKRAVRLAEVADWVADVPVTRIAVVVNPDVALLRQIVDSGLFEAVQFHGDESAAECAAVGGRWLRAVRVSGEEALTEALTYETPWLLLDAYSAAGYGGTGASLDLGLAAGFVHRAKDRRVVLAGGLTPDSVGDAVRQVQPHGVDVASGVEVPGDPRRKDAGRVREFVAAAKGAGTRRFEPPFQGLIL